jgi:prepilin-type N-terminal cleavage/methylation domain-containing protein
MEKKYLKKIYIKGKKGFSLIEMMVVVVVMGLIILGLVTFFTGGTRSWITGQSQLSAQRNARQAMDWMVREIRHGEAVTSATLISITVAVPDLGTKPSYDVTYSLSGTTINRDDTPLISNVKKLEFSYPDASKVHIVLEVDVDKDSNPDITLNSDINLRNFGL